MSTRVRARDLLITRIKERIPETPLILMDPVIDPKAETEDWEKMAKRRKTEKQAKVTHLSIVYNCIAVSNDHVSYLPLF